MRNASRPPAEALSLERGLAVLNLLSVRFRGGARAAELQGAMSIPRASLYRVLKALGTAGLVSQGARDGRFRLGLGMMKLGYTARAVSPLVQAVQPILREIARATHQMGELAVAVDRWQLMMLDTWQAEQTPVPVLARPGLFFGLNHSTAHGLCYLTFDGPRRLETYLRVADTNEGQRTLEITRNPVPADLFEQLERCRRLGFAHRRQSGPRAFARVAAPVFDPHSSPRRLAGALGLVCEPSALSALKAAEWGRFLKAKALELEAGL